MDVPRVTFVLRLGSFHELLVEFLFSLFFRAASTAFLSFSVL